MELRFKSYPETHSLLNRLGDDSDRLTLDLSNVQFVKPSLLVVVAAIATAHRDQLGVAPRFVPPTGSDPCVYASRMSLGEVLSEVGIDETGLPSVRHHQADERLCQLTRFENNTECGQLVNLVQQRCEAAGYRYEAEEALTMSIWELADNCLAHARIGHGFLAAQVLPRPKRSLHFAVADGGIGIRTSLAGTQHECDDDRSAIEAAIEPRVTSVQGKPRGIGLPNLLEWVTAIGGVLTIRSGRAAIEYRLHPNSDVPSATSFAVDDLHGTLVAGWVPC